MTPEELARHRERCRLRARAYRATISEEKQAEIRAKARERANARYRAMSEEERKAEKSRQYTAWRNKLAAMPADEQRAVMDRNNKKFRAWWSGNEKAQQSQRDRRANLPPAEKARRLEKARRRSAATRSKMTAAEKRENTEYQRRWRADRMATDPAFRVMAEIRNRLRHARARRNLDRPVSTSEALGCTWKHFCGYLESQFEARMTWENEGRYTWHIDHVVPLAAFDLGDEREAKVAQHYLNHRPMWHDENMAKAAKMPAAGLVPPALREMCLELDADFFSRRPKAQP